MKQKKRILTKEKGVNVLALWILVFSLVLMNMGTFPENGYATNIETTVNILTPRIPIRIDSNADFDEAHGVTGGNGTEANPWIIENYDINGSGYGYCIYIGNTTDYFAVRNCNLHEASGFSGSLFWPDAGLTLCVVDNGDISNNIIHMNGENGIYMLFSDNNTLFNNTISGMKGKEGFNGQPATGIHLESSTHNFLVGNDIFNISGGNCAPGGIEGAGSGIQLYSSSDNLLLDNEISDIHGGELVYFRDDMESGSEKWVHSSTVMNINGECPLEYYFATELDIGIISDWNYTASISLENTTTTYHSFDTCFYMNETNNNKTAVTETFSLENLGSANLSFWHKYNMTADENGGFLQVGYKDPGVPGLWNWKYLTPVAYTGNLNASAQVKDSFDAPISECWNGVSGGGTFDWECVGIDLLDHVPIAYNDEVRIKLNYTQLGSGIGVGWYIDDVRLVVSRDENATISANDKDIWNLTDAMAHSGDHSWSNVDPVTGYMKPGIDNYLTTKPIDITAVKNAYLSAYLKFNINEDNGVPPDGFRVEVTTDNGVTWLDLTLGVRSAWGVSGTGADADDGNPTDGKTYSGLPDSSDPVADDYWVEAGTLTRLNIDLTPYSGNVIQIRFRVVTSNNLSYEHNNNLNYPDPGFGGFYLDDVEVLAEGLFVLPTSDSKGIYLRDSVNNTISSNTLSNTYKSIRLWDSSGNSIYHNNFINNTYQASDNDNNQWDDGYPGGGNYWSDYNGSDIYHGPDQNYSGGDGIGDIEHTVIGGPNMDNYPLMVLWDPSSPVAEAGPVQWADEDTVVHLNGSGSSDNHRIANYTWTFHDNNDPVYLFRVNPSYVFADPGTYIITLNVTGIGGIYAKDTCTIFVNDTTNPTADAGLDQWVELNDEGHITVYLDGSGSTDNSGLINYTWIVYDGDQISLPDVNPSYVFTRPEIYIVTLNITDAAGYYDTDSCIIYVNDSIPPVISDVLITPSAPTNRDNVIIVCNVIDNVELANVNFTYLHNGTIWMTYPMVNDASSLYRVTFGPVNQNFTFFINATDTIGNTATYHGNVIVRKALIEATSEGLDPELETGSIIRITGNVYIDGEINATGLYVIALLNGEEIARCPVNENGSYILEFILPQLLGDDNHLEIQVVDEIGGNVQEIESIIIPGKQLFPWFMVFFASAIAGTSVALGLATEVGKYALLMLFLPLYSKIRKDRVLDQETRGMIRGYIMANPGDHYNSIMKALDLSNGTFAYHIKVLEGEEIIKSKTDGIYKRFYPYELKIVENGGYLKQSQKIIIEKIKAYPGISRKDISKLLGVNPSTINYRLQEMIRQDFIKAERQGMIMRYYVNDEKFQKINESKIK